MEEDRRYRERQKAENNKRDRTILPGMSEAEIVEIVSYRVKKRQDKKREFNIHLGIFVLCNAFLFMLWAILGGGFPWPLIVVGGWGIGLFAHFMDLTQSLSSVQSRRDRLVQEEVEREKERLGLYEKPKRDSVEKSKNRSVSIGSEGEIVPLEELLDDEDEQDEPRYQRNRR